MPRRARNTNLETRTARLKLAVGRHPYRHSIERGLLLLYYRGAKRGSWSVRIYRNGKYEEHALGLADDYDIADGVKVLSFPQAQDKARETRKDISAPGWRSATGYTVAKAIDDYLEYFKARRKSFKDVSNRLTKHVIPKLGDRLVNELTAEEVERWHHTIAQTKAGARSGKDGKANYRQETDPRARKATANRVLAYLKAALNHARKRGKTRNDDWNRVEPFAGVESPRSHYLTVEQAERLLNSCDADFRPMVKAALLTGCRYSELAKLKAQDFDSDNASLYIDNPKSSRSRYVHLNTEGKAFFTRATAGKDPSVLIFPRADGEPWGQAHQIKRIRDAAKRARLPAWVTFHILRHTYGSQLATAGVPLQVIAQLMGHSNVSVTEKYYAHLHPSAAKRAVLEHLPNYGAGEGPDNVTPLRRKKGKQSAARAER